MFETKAVIVAFILTSGYVITYGSVLRTSPKGMVFENDLNSVNEEYNTYAALSNNHDRNNINNDNEDDTNTSIGNNRDTDVYAQIEQYYLNKLQSRRQLQNIPRPKPSKVERTAYLLVKTMRQRDKRYVSFVSDLTLCHFKICNMGRKRTTRYFHMIRTLNDDAGS